MVKFAIRLDYFEDVKPMLYRLLGPIWRKTVRPLWYRVSGKDKEALLMLFEAYDPSELLNFTLTRSTPQSITFAKDMFLYVKNAISEYMADKPDVRSINILDIGGGNGAGSEYIRAQLQIHIAKAFPSRSAKINMTMIESGGEYEEWCNRFSPKITFLNVDIFTHEKIYDFVICSHVIEHVEAPIEFIKRMQCMAKERLFVYAPYNEHPLSQDGHINKIDDKFISALDSHQPIFIKSKAWRPKGGCVLIILPGKAATASI